MPYRRAISPLTILRTFKGDFYNAKKIFYSV
uniref:Uncharacterized protein n=1 Tax=Siphoviridae sp. ctF7F8 TaxID=2826211 RepID=A0A8S5MJM0_9CAUD|nr:MAG TPA: hypothetical protein [Siphoviridae sp. ctF7F8]